MGAYILIVIFSTANNYSNVTMQEFANKNACAFAAQQIIQNWQASPPPRATLCVPKLLEPAKKAE